MSIQCEGAWDLFHDYDQSEFDVIHDAMHEAAAIELGAKFWTTYKNSPRGSKIRLKEVDCVIGPINTGDGTRLGGYLGFEVMGGTFSPQLIAKGNVTIVKEAGDLIAMYKRTHLHPIMEEADIRLALVDGVLEHQEV